MLITINTADDTPLFEQIAASIRSHVVHGTISPGDRLPSAVELGESLDVNRNTVLHAYQLLREEGLVELRRGRGATVTPKAALLTDLADALQRLVADAKALDISATTLTHLIRETY